MIAIKIKPGVRLYGIRPEMVLAIQVAAHIYEGFVSEMWVTSCIDGEHKQNSKHYTGSATDFRTSNLPADKISTVRDAVAVCLGPDYDVVLEVDHLHIEFDPKTSY